ncbi:hypothetical protein PSENEW3_00005730 [Picochlorum sp. SENEW3]|nr:hypothetical protein PSENEW3_00005730 [Picochlorum sp. SENEW3]
MWLLLFTPDFVLLVAEEMRFPLVLSLIGLALLELSAAAEYSICPSAGPPISCCKSPREIPPDGFPGIVTYKCDECDPGFAVSASKEQCRPVNVCKAGEGLVRYDSTACQPCDVKDCKSCYESFVTCTKCRRGFDLYKGRCLRPIPSFA